MMREMGRSHRNGVRRISYVDGNNLIERIVHDSREHDPVIAANKEAVDNFQRHQTMNEPKRKVAEVPVDLYLRWLNEAGLDGYLDEETVMHIMRTKLNDPQYQEYRTVPPSYRI
jgi:hypothetical protein